MIPVRHCCRCSSPRQFRCQHAPAPVRPRRHATPRRLRFSTPHASLVRRTSSGLAKTASSSLFFSYRRSLRSFFGTQPADKEQGISAESFLILSFPFCHSCGLVHPSYLKNCIPPISLVTHALPVCAVRLFFLSLARDSSEPVALFYRLSSWSSPVGTSSRVISKSIGHPVTQRFHHEQRIPLQR